MTLGDVEMATVFRETWRYTRKPRRCDCCGRHLEIGWLYLDHFSVNDGRPSSEVLCLWCWVMRQSWVDAAEEFIPNPSFTAECLSGEADSMGPWPGPPRSWPLWVRMERVLRRRLARRTWF